MESVLTLILTTITVCLIQSLYHWVKDKLFGRKKNNREYTKK